MSEKLYRGPASLWYPCCVCGKSVCHESGPHVLDNMTTMFCPECGGATLVMFAQAPVAAQHCVNADTRHALEGGQVSDNQGGL